MLDHPKLVAQFWNAETKFQIANSPFSLKRKGAFGIWEYYAKAKIPRAEEIHTLQYSRFFKIGLTNFGNNKNVAPFIFKPFLN